MLPPAASAHFDASEPYTYRACPPAPSRRVDPVNVVFYGWGTWGRAVNQIEAHAGWTATSGSGQSFVDHGGCYGMHAQRAGGEGAGFDQGRDELLDRFAAAGHVWSPRWWGNTQSFKQCDGDDAASDGWTLFVELHQVNH